MSDRDDRLDARLDRTLRGLMEGEGPPDLRARVLARVADGGARRPNRLLPVLAAAATLVIGVVLLRPSRERGPALPPPLPPPMVSRAQLPSAPPAVPGRRPSADTWRPAPGLVEPLTEPPPIAVDTLGWPAPEIAPVAVEGLEVEALQFAPLSSQ